jgi:hypothetical protein
MQLDMFYILWLPAICRSMEQNKYYYYYFFYYLYSSPNVRDQVSRQYKTIDKIIILYIFYVFKQRSRRQKIPDWMVASITRI